MFLISFYTKNFDLLPLISGEQPCALRPSCLSSADWYIMYPCNVTLLLCFSMPQLRASHEV